MALDEQLTDPNASNTGRATEALTIDELSIRYIEQMAHLDPVLATSWGIPGREHLLTEQSTKRIILPVASTSALCRPGIRAPSDEPPNR